MHMACLCLRFLESFTLPNGGDGYWYYVDDVRSHCVRLNLKYTSHGKCWGCRAMSSKIESNGWQLAGKHCVGHNDDHRCLIWKRWYSSFCVGHLRCVISIVWKRLPLFVGECVACVRTLVVLIIIHLPTIPDSTRASLSQHVDTCWKKHCWKMPKRSILHSAIVQSKELFGLQVHEPRNSSVPSSPICLKKHTNLH